MSANQPWDDPTSRNGQTGLPVGPVPPPGGPDNTSGRIFSTGTPPLPPEESPPRRLRRLHRLWPDRDGNISYLLTLCIDGRAHVLNNETVFQRLAGFLLESPVRYRWFERRFVIMPDHLHLIARMGHEAIRLGQWVKAMKAVLGGLERRPTEPGVPPDHHQFIRTRRSWRWQDSFHDRKFRTPESESRKWEYVCLNPVRKGLVQRPEQWPFGGEIFYDEAGIPELVRGTPPLLEAGRLLEPGTPGGGTRPTG